MPRTGDDRPASHLARYMWRMTGRWQVGACLLAMLVSLVNLAPIELQRRVVDDAVTEGDVGLLAVLGAAYLAVTLAHKALKFALQNLQGWLGESAALYTRRHLLSLRADRRAAPGETVSILTAEVDKLAGFVGAAPSQAFVNLTMLIGVSAYMIYVEPKIALVSLALLVPQVALTPYLQAKINRLLAVRLKLVRGFGDAVAELDAEAAERLTGRIYRNRLRANLWKFALKGLLNLMNALAPISVLLWGGWLVIQGETTLGVLLAFVSGFDRLSAPLRELITFYRSYAQARVHHEMIARWM